MLGSDEGLFRPDSLLALLCCGGRLMLFRRTVPCVPDFDLEAFDLLDQDQDRLPGGAKLVPSISGQADPPAS
jgi:hypothetical protein